MCACELILLDADSWSIPVPQTLLTHSFISVANGARQDLMPSPEETLLSRQNSYERNDGGLAENCSCKYTDNVRVRSVFVTNGRCNGISIYHSRLGFTFSRQRSRSLGRRQHLVTKMAGGSHKTRKVINF